MTRQFLLALAAVCGFLVATVIIIAAALWMDLPASDQAMLLPLLSPRAGLVVLVLSAACCVAGLALKWGFQAHVAAPLKMAEELRLMLSAHRSLRLAAKGSSALAELSTSVNALADQRDALERDVLDQIQLAKTSVEEEKNRLAALMSELSQSVVVCNLDGRILLYNNRARREFQALAQEGGAVGALIGLGRSIFTVVERNLISHALDNLQRQLDKEGHARGANFVTITRAGQLVRVQMAPVLSAEEGRHSIGGYVLMLENITRAVEMESRRDLMLQQLTEGSRAALANIRAAVETLLDYADIEAGQRDRFLHIISDEVLGMGSRLDQTLARYADSLKARWPLEEVLGADLIAAAQRRIESRLALATRVDELDPELWLKVDSYSLIQAMNYLASRLKESFGIRLLRFRLAPAGRFAHLDMVWSGAPASTETFSSWELEPMNLSGEDSPLTLRDVMDRHGGELWFQRESATQQAYFRLLIPLAVPQDAALAAVFVRGDSRPEFYDFDLFKRRDQDHALDERLLTDLTYTVFDTETTGLDPSAGDEIIQLGAVRIVNGRLLRQEGFEQLIDPRRPLPPAAIAIHGITAEMVAGAPTIERVLPRFYQFAEDTVLVAHNAAFDMRFLQLKEEVTGVRFIQPVLDTLLLSALIHPNQESHSLEAIAERFGVSLIGRHTALGDAIVTGELFLKMIPLLNAMGIFTLHQTLLAARETYYARVTY